MNNRQNTQKGACSMNQNTDCKKLNDLLLESVNNEDLDKVEELLKEGVDVNIEGEVAEYGCIPISPLSLAADKGCVEIVRSLLQSPNIDANQKDYYKHTALHRASSNGHLEVVEALLATKKVDINAELAKVGSTPLHLASSAGHVEVVEALLKSPEILVNKKDQSGMTSLHRASSGGHVEVVNVLLNVPGISVNEKDYANDHTPLHLAADFRHFDVVEALLSNLDTDVNVTDKYLQTPLHSSAYHGELKVVELLLQGGINANKKTKTGYTAAYWAAKQGHSRVVQMIVNHLKHVEVHGVETDSRRKQAEDLGRRIELVKISKKHKDTNITGNDPNRQLLLAAANDDLEKVEELLIQPGIDVNSVDQNGNTPLHLASEKGYAELVKVLLKVKDIDVNAKNKDKSKSIYPIHQGDDPNRSRLDFGKTPLYLAVQKGQVDVVKLLLDHPEVDVNAKDKYSVFPLWLAVEYGNNKIVEALLNHSSIDVNAKYICSDHFTSLHMAVERGNLEMVIKLLSHPNIDVNMKDEYYKGTALHISARTSNLKIVSAILNHPKVNLNAKNKHNCTPLQEAEGNGFTPKTIINLLREATSNLTSVRQKSLHTFRGDLGE